MKTTTIRVTCSNNSDARALRVGLDGLDHKARHNGGKLVIVTVDAADVDAARGLLDDSHAVASYEVQS